MTAASWSWPDDRDAYCRLADDGCPNCGGAFRARLAPEERAAVLAQWDRFARKLANLYHRRHPTFDRDDVLSEVRFGFVVAATRFDPSRLHSFPTYAAYWAKSTVYRYIDREIGQVAPAALEGTRSIISLSLRGRARSAELSADIPAKEPEPAPEFPADFWRRAASVLDKRSALVVELYFREGLTHERIAARLGVTRTRVWQIHQRSIAKLRSPRLGLLAVMRAA